MNYGALATLLENAAVALRQAEKAINSLPQCGIDEKVESLELSVRARKICRRAGIMTLSDLCSHSPEDLHQFKNCGITTIREIREKLRACGLSLRNDNPESAWPLRNDEP